MSQKYKYAVRFLRLDNKGHYITNRYIIACIIICIQWMFVPLVINAFEIAAIRRKQNVINIRFPVSIHMYNQYYVLCYTYEVILVSFTMYITIIIDTLIKAFCCVIIVLYQILTKSFANVGYKNKPILGKKNAL